MLTPHGTVQTTPSQIAAKKSSRLFYILILVQLVAISFCLFLLVLNQYLNFIVDDYSPAYPTPDDDDDDDDVNLRKIGLSEMLNDATTPQQKLRMFHPVNAKILTHQPTTSPRTYHSMVSKVTDNWLHSLNKHPKDEDLNATHSEYIDEDEKRDVKTNESNDSTMKSWRFLKMDEPKQVWIDLFVGNLNSRNGAIRITRDYKYNNDTQKHGKLQTKLTSLLLMYPCCVSAIILVCMQLISRLTNDTMFKSTLVTLISTCILLGMIIFAVSIFESVQQRNPLTILIGVGSGIFILLEVIDLTFLFVSKSN